MKTESDNLSWTEGMCCVLLNPMVTETAILTYSIFVYPALQSGFVQFSTHYNNNTLHFLRQTKGL